MKKFLISFGLLSLVFGSLTVPVFASDLLPVCSEKGVSDSTVCKQNNQAQTPQNNSIYGPNGILTKIATILSVIVGAVCIIVIIIGGFRYVLSGGDPQQTASAKNTILYAIVGLVVTIAARTIIIFVLGRLK